MFLDTSGLLCLLDQRDVRHEDAAMSFDNAAVLVTHNYVLAEFVPLCQSRGLNREAALMFAADILDNPDVEVEWVDEPLHRGAATLLQSRMDKTYSLCDAVSFLIMRQYGVIEALTTDQHFEQEGFIRLLAP